MIFASPLKLKQKGIMGMNCRNVDFIGQYNERRLFPLVDDKLKTKKIAIEAGASVPELIATIQYQAQVKSIHSLLKGWSGFAIKPAKGSGGKGILVITKVEDGIYYKASGSKVSKAEIERHVTNILSGLFSLGGKNDIAIIEDLIQFDNVFDGFSHEGVPDVRVIIFKGYPVMAMMRLSTAASDGKANLHQGAVGVGIDLKTGCAVSGVQHGQPVTKHPDTDKLLAHLKIPHWSKLLELAASAYEMTTLGYIGVDMVLDKVRGPMILELNARPGLAIQIANGRGMLDRVNAIKKIKHPSPFTIPTPKERAEYSMELFKKDKL